LGNKPPAALGIGCNNLPDNSKVCLSDITAPISRNGFHARHYKASETGTQEISDHFFQKNVVTESLTGMPLPRFIELIQINPDSNIFYDAIVLLGTPGINQTKKPIRLVGYIVDGTKYWVATDRFDLTAEQIAFIYKLRWDVEKFFAWWKRHLKVYHLIARSEYGLMVQILAGLITYLLLAIYCREQHNEKVSIKRVRELRIKIQNEIRMATSNMAESHHEKHGNSALYAST